MTITLHIALMTGDRHEQVVALLTSLIFQEWILDTTLWLYDNGRQPILESPMARGLLELATRVYDWCVIQKYQKGESFLDWREELLTDVTGQPGDYILLTDDDVIWTPGSVPALIEVLDKVRAVCPVVVDLLDRGFPDFTGGKRLRSSKGVSSPMHHLYNDDVDPFAVDSFAGVFMTRLRDLKKCRYHKVPMIDDTLLTRQLPNPKMCVPAAEVWHLPHTRSPSYWESTSLPKLLRDGQLEYVGE